MTTTQGAIRRLELLLARTPDMECADDLRVVLADAVLSRRLLDDAREPKPVGETCFDAQGIRWYNTSDRERLPFGTKLYAAPVPAQPAVPDFIPALYSWLARAHFDNQQDEVTASRFGQQLHAWITAQPSAVSEAVAKASKLLRAHNEWRRGADNTDAYTATGLGNAIDTVCDHIEEVLGMVSTQIIPADVMNDAARYQWLKQRSPFGNRAPHIEQYPFQSGFDKVKLPHFTVVGLDDAIDAAIDAALLSAADTEVKNG